MLQLYACQAEILVVFWNEHYLFITIVRRTILTCWLHFYRHLFRFDGHYDISTTIHVLHLPNVYSLRLRCGSLLG